MVLSVWLISTLVVSVVLACVRSCDVAVVPSTVMLA